MLATVGDGLVPQGRALIKQREGVTDRPSRTDGEGSEGGQREREGPAVSFTSERKRGKKGYVCVHVGTGAETAQGTGKGGPGLECHPLLIFWGGYLPNSPDDSS